MSSLTVFSLEVAQSLLDSGIEFPVDFDALWVWCGYSRKDSALRMLQDQMSESLEFIVSHTKEEDVTAFGGYRSTTKYWLSVDAAKMFAMMAKTEKGKEVRKYFIECERIAKEKAQPKQLTTLEILKLATEAEEGRLLAESQVLLLKEKVMIDAPYTAMGQIIEEAKGELKIGEYGKVIGVGQNKLFDLLRDKGILSSAESNWNVPYQKFIDGGYFRCTEKVTPVGIKLVPLVTPRGQIWLQKQLSNILVLRTAN